MNQSQTASPTVTLSLSAEADAIVIGMGFANVAINVLTSYTNNVALTGIDFLKVNVALRSAARSVMGVAHYAWAPPHQPAGLTAQGRKPRGPSPIEECGEYSSSLLTPSSTNPVAYSLIATPFLLEIGRRRRIAMPVRDHYRLNFCRRPPRRRRFIVIPFRARLRGSRTLETP
ncbi:hypothetical protein [Mesorhizobium hawassense]|uniref:hypothetical protein n=1 Tax=Mesorhizobium hawassense TaxID=1209954 RepID=UPI001FDFF2A9|nr:hypothetical protein [Mesorhizobium hawassense]